MGLSCSFGIKSSYSSAGVMPVSMGEMTSEDGGNEAQGRKDVAMHGDTFNGVVARTGKSWL